LYHEEGRYWYLHHEDEKRDVRKRMMHYLKNKELMEREGPS